LGDLVSTTNSYKQVQDRENRLGSDLALAQAQLFPLRKENARLSRENHALHVEKIRSEDEHMSTFDNHVIAVRKLEDQIMESKLLLAAKDKQSDDNSKQHARFREVSLLFACYGLNLLLIG
jgi:hypothetical protein